MRLYKLIIITLIILLNSCNNNTLIHPVNGGKASLRQSDFDNGATAKLDGEWLFWPNQLLTYKEIQKSISNNKEYYVESPGLWGKLGLFESKKSLINNGTLALILDMPTDGTTWSIRVPNSNSATSLYLNDTLLSEIGKTSLNIDNFIPNSNINMADFIPNVKENILIMHVTNFSTPYTGTWESITIGKPEDIHQKRMWNIIMTSLISGALIFMSLHNFTHYMLRKNEKALLWFSLICLFMATRNLMMGERIIINFFPVSWLSWRIAFNIEHLSAHLTLPLFFLFFRDLFKEYINIVMVKIVLVVSLIWTVLQLFTPIMVHHRFLSLFEYFLAIFALYMFSSILRALKNKVEGASITAVGLLILVGFSINDVLLSNGIIQSIYISSFGVFIYTFTQSYFLSKRFSNLFDEVARYSNELKELNSSLERFIPQEVLKFLDKSSIVDVKLGDYSEQEMSVFFLDIRDFTSFSETMSPNDNFRFINSFLKRFGPLIRRCGGFVDKYIGDGIMALFPGSPDDALKAALLIRSTLINFNNERMGFGLVPIKVGIGINTGNLMLGTIGENQRMDSTVISDAVNTASRLESLTKELKVDILISEITVQKLVSPERFRLNHVGGKHLKGKVVDVDIYTIDWAD